MKVTKALIPAVGYIRMSTDMQEHSPAQQREEIIKLAKRLGYKIVRWYQDPGISGDEIEKRPDFCRMLNDAQKRGDFQAILCWDQDRFGRFDLIRAGLVIEPLRQCGVSLVTVCQGVINWNDFSGRMMYAIQQEGKHQFLRDLSRNTLRGKLKSARDGEWSGNPPYGFDRMYRDERGNEIKRVPFGERFKKPKGWKCQLAISEDEAAVARVRWIFEHYATTATTISAMIRRLNLQGVPAPRGGTWCQSTVEQILRNPAYLGHTAYGRYRLGKFHQMSDGGEVEAAQGRRRSAEGALLVKDTHEALVSVEVFEQCRCRLKALNEVGGRERISRYPLSGVLRCGHCNGRMHGSEGRQKSRRYICTNGVTRGLGVCRAYSIPADVIESFLHGWIVGLLLSDDNLGRLEGEISARAAARSELRSERSRALQTQIARLDARIAKGAENLLLVDSADLPGASRLLNEWRSERRKLQQQLDAELSRVPKPRRRKDTATQHALRELLQLRQSLGSVDPVVARTAFRQVFDSVLLWWSEIPVEGKRKVPKVRFSRGLINPVESTGPVRKVLHSAMRTRSS